MERLIAFFESLNWDRWPAPATTAARILLILVAAWIAVSVLQKIARAARARIASRYQDADRVRRAETLGRVFRYAIAVGVGTVAGMLVLAELGVSLAPVLGAAGVVGIALGFGAQSLVKDYFTGFFILIEDQIRNGDVVKIADIGGFVEDITLRHVRLRDYDGHVHFIPNSLITTVTNMSRLFAQSVIDVRVPYRENVENVLAVMREVGQELRRDESFGPRILDDIEIVGVERLEESAMILRCRFKVVPLEQWNVRREYYKRLKGALDARGIAMPYPHLAIYAGTDNRREPPASLPVRIDGAAQAG